MADRRGANHRARLPAGRLGDNAPQAPPKHPGGIAAPAGWSWRGADQAQELAQLADVLSRPLLHRHRRREWTLALPLAPGIRTGHDRGR
jgi:hypothetical protein